MKTKFSGTDLASQEYSKKLKSEPKNDSSLTGQGTITRFLLITISP